jgi:tetratricopeptide (TPR) repeat protein
MPERKQNERDVLLSFAARVDRNDPGALNNLGVLYYRKGVYDEAIKQFKEALKIDPRFELARENLQYLFAETKMEDPDVSRWRQEVDKDPDNDEALLRLGISYQNMGRLEEASDILGQVVARNPEHYMARIHLGAVLKARGLHQQALEHYLCAEENVGTSAVFHTDLGEIYYNLGRTDEAISELRTAIKLDAEFWRSHFLLSFAFGDIGHFQEALEENRIASKLNPSFQNTEANLALSNDEQGGQQGMGMDIPSLESTSFTLGTAYRERGYLKEALKEFRKALQDMPDKDRVHLEMGKVHLAEGDNDEALSSLLKALQENPENPDAYRLCGTVYHVLADNRKAAVCYLQSFRLDSADADTMNNLGVLLYQVGLVEEAERMFKKGLNLKLYNLELNFNYLASILFREEYMMAENLLQRLEAFTGKSAVLYEKRALLHYKLNRMTLALFDIESALACDKRHADALYLKGMIFLREENFRSAIQCILEAAAIRPEYTGLHFFLSHGEQLMPDPVRVEAKLPEDPPDELIELLQAGVNRRFDTIRGHLVSVVEEGMAELAQRREQAEADTAAKAADAPVAKESRPRAGGKGKTAAADAAPRKKPSGGDEKPGSVDLLEELKFDM